MKQLSTDNSWLNELFEDDFGNSLSKLKDEYDTLICCDTNKLVSISSNLIVL